MSLKKTSLHEIHQKLDAKMGAFAGYDMPLFYPGGVIQEHEWVRSHAGLFDVSHMGQISIKGPGALEYMQKLTPSAYEKMTANRTKYTVLINEQGGIIDDLMVVKAEDGSFHCVINAGCKDKDIAWMKSHLTKDLEFTYYDDWSLLALQGPDSEKVLKEALGYDLSTVPYMSLWARDDYQMFINRLGYTGEDGFEISIPNASAVEIWNKLLAHESVKPIGLAARDSLRLEMGYCLYGHDIDETTTPLEADLGWVMSKTNKSFIGADKALAEPARKRVGIKILDPGIAREGTEIRNAKDEKIGTLTSGGHSPSLKASIGQGYVEINYATPGTKIFVNVRSKNLAAEITPMPFRPAQTKSAKS